MLKPIPLRFITAASLFDGHDAAINIMRRILQSSGAEVIHLGHNRSVAEIVDAALQEDAHAIALSTYQGGHVEYLKYMIDMLRGKGGEKIKVFAGGGGVIVADEVQELEEYGVERIYTPEDGQAIGLQGLIDDMLVRSRRVTDNIVSDKLVSLHKGGARALSRVLTQLESQPEESELSSILKSNADKLTKNSAVLGITGTGGAGKSSLTDELILRFRGGQNDKLKIAILAVDPTRRKTGGALLGDRIRMNAVDHPNIFMRSIATRNSATEIPEYVPDMVNACRVAGFDLVIVETPGIGQGDAGISKLADVSLYVMTPEFGAQTQLEKIDMLDFADVVAINKFDRRGARDAYRDVCKQVQRNREAFSEEAEDMPVFGTIASRFNDNGITALYQELLVLLTANGLKSIDNQLPHVDLRCSSAQTEILPTKRVRYLAEIAEMVRNYKVNARQQAVFARQRQQLLATQQLLKESGENDMQALQQLYNEVDGKLNEKARHLVDSWGQMQQDYSGEQYIMQVRDKKINIDLLASSLSGNRIPKVAIPEFEDDGERLKWLMLENLPGRFPFVAGVFEFKRADESPTRMFAGEGDALRTNKRFKALSEHSSAKRLSTAFDSVTLYGCDPDERPDIYGKVGNSGVSIATVEDIQALYDGFDLCDPNTSVSMTINGPAPMILAFFLNAAIRQTIAKYTAEHGKAPDAQKEDKLRAWTLANVRGTVQADILKEDQGQNTCIFSTEFALKMMADIQEYFVQHKVRNFYSVSISGYHIAEAGANPISQLAFTLANGFTYVEAYLARGMDIDDFAQNLSFFFSNGMCPEYTVLGRVARRIWAVTMRDKYGANERSQKLKYHVQTSGRSLHAQELDFNDIRTTLQALIAINDNCNSLHTNAYDEAITTPTDESVRRALAIQMIINTEWGLAMNENPNQGSFIIEQLTELVEEAVLLEFERIAERGGVLGAMETGYQRGKIQDESMLYEKRKHDGSLPIVGVNTFLNPNPATEGTSITLARSTDDEKLSQLSRLRDFKLRHARESEGALKRLTQAALNGGNIFTALMDASRYCSLGQLSDELYQVGGKYRRNM